MSDDFNDLFEALRQVQEKMFIQRMKAQYIMKDVGDLLVLYDKMSGDYHYLKGTTHLTREEAKDHLELQKTKLAELL